MRPKLVSDNVDTGPAVYMVLGNVEVAGEFPVEKNEVDVVRNTEPVPASIAPAPEADPPAQTLLRHLGPPIY